MVGVHVFSNALTNRRWGLGKGEGDSQLWATAQRQPTPRTDKGSGEQGAREPRLPLGEAATSDR